MSDREIAEAAREYVSILNKLHKLKERPRALQLLHLIHFEAVGATQARAALKAAVDADTVPEGSVVVSREDLALLVSSFDFCECPECVDEAAAINRLHQLLQDSDTGGND